MKPSHTTLLQHRSSSRRTTITSLVLFIGVLLLPLTVSAASLRIEGERAWLNADGEPLPEILQLFEGRGIKVFVDPAIKPRKITGDWKNVEVGKLIAQIASPHSYVITWEREQGHSKDHFQVSGIRIFPDGKPFAARSISSNSKVLDVVEGEDGTQYIRGEILLGLSKDFSSENFPELLNRLNGTVIEVIDPPGLYRIKLSGEMSVEAALRIAMDYDGVAAAEPNLAFPSLDSGVLPLVETSGNINLNLFPGESAIAVFDSGLDPAYADYPFIRGTYDALDPNAEISDPTGHGTLTSLIAAGAITPLGADAAESGVPVYSIRTFDENGMTSSDTIMRALEYAANSGVKIVSMSWGTEVTSKFLETAMDFATQNGMTLFAAAGNEPTGTPVYPAGYDSVIAVGGLNPDGSQWEKSNYGDFVESYEPAMATFNNVSYAGTSIATPYAAFQSAQGEPE